MAFWYIPIISIRVHQLHWIPSAVGIGTYARVLVRHRVNGEEDAREGRVVVARTEVVIACFRVFFLAGEGESIFVGKQALKINMLQMPKIEDSGSVESTVWVACYGGVSMQNGLSLWS